MQMGDFSRMQLMELSPTGAGTWSPRRKEWLFAGGLAQLPDLDDPVGGCEDHCLQP